MSEKLKETLGNKDWRMKKLYSIVDKNAKRITFKYNEVQEHFNKNRAKRNIILKSRQLGFTTYEAIEMLDDCLFTPNFEALFIAHTKDDAVTIFNKKIDYAWKNVDDDLRQLWKVETDRSNELKFDFGDKTFSSIAVSNSGRSGTYSKVHISEFAKLCKNYPSRAEEVITGTIPAVHSNSEIDIESTAEGETGSFYEMFWEAWNRGEPRNPKEFKAHFYNWTWDKAEIAKVVDILPTEQMAHGDRFTKYKKEHNLSDQEINFYYQQWVSLNKSWNRLHQEYPTTPEEAFVASGAKMFDMEQVASQKQYEKEGEKIGDWLVFDEYDRKRVYAIGADVSEGVRKDSSTAIIWDFTGLKPRVVAEYKCNSVSPDNFAYELRNGGNRYGTPLICVERNNHGHTTLSKLKEIYPTPMIYKEIKHEKTHDQSTGRLGWLTNLATKPKMMYDLSTAIEDDIIEIPSRMLREEMRTYDKEDLDRIKSDEEMTRHWDLLIAAAIGFQMRNHVKRPLNKDNVKKIQAKYNIPVRDTNDSGFDSY